MTNVSGIAGLLGLARRAGKLVVGADSVKAAIQQRKIFMVLLAEDASYATAKKIEDLARKHSVPFFYSESKDRLGGLMGRDQLAVLGITDSSLADGARRHLGET